MRLESLEKLEGSSVSVYSILDFSLGLRSMPSLCCRDEYPPLMDADLSENEDDETDDDEVVATRSGFAALAVDSDEETAARQYAYSSDDESGMFISMSDMLTPEDLKESRRGERRR